MIISASRRTDIPAFYAPWFMNRIRAGYCMVPNPFNPKQISHVSLKPEDVDIIVFWTRDPTPLMSHIKSLDERGYRYYFLYTLMDNPRLMDPKSPPVARSIKSFQRLADRIGPEKVIWRYDPILFSDVTDPDFHEKTFRFISNKLRGFTFRSVISLVKIYRKTRKRLEDLSKAGLEWTDCTDKAFEHLMSSLSQAAFENGMEIFSCAQKMDLTPYGIPPGKCIDDRYIARFFNIRVAGRKDPSQRKACGCVVSKDIGMYDTCLFGCKYCYATSSLERAKARHAKHDPDSPSLI